jgi:Domain of unknown function (DUF4864)
MHVVAQASWLRCGAVLVLALLACGGIPVAHCQAAESATGTTMRATDWAAVRKVIADQRSALKAGDAAKAFGYASPGIRGQFGDAEHFIDMVRTAYSALLTARYVEFLEGAVIDGTIIQPLRLIDGDNTVRVALYTMERQGNGVWRISGCQIAPSTVQAT